MQKLPGSLDDGLLSNIGYWLLMVPLFVLAIPSGILLVAIILGYFMWFMIFWLCERLSLPIKSVAFGLINLLVFLRDASPIILLCGLVGSIIGMCGGTGTAGFGCLLGGMLGLFIQMIRMAEYDCIPKTELPPRERREWGGWGDDEGFWYGGNQSYHPPVTVVKHLDTSSRIKKTVPRNPWAWQGFQTREGPKEDDIRMDL